MLTIFSSAVVTAPAELLQAGNQTPTVPKKSSDGLITTFANNFPSSISISISSLARMSYTHDSQSLLHPRYFAVKDEIFCLFEGCLENLASLKQHYGLGKNANEVVLVMEAYRALRDRAPYPTNHMLAHLVGDFAFLIFDMATSTVFVASDQDGKVPMFFGITEDGCLAFSNEAEILHGSLASFPSD